MKTKDLTRWLQALARSFALTAGAMGVAFVAACEGPNDDAELGSIGLNLRVPVPYNINVVVLQITHPDMETIYHSVMVGEAGTVAVRLGELPEGSDYQLTMTAGTVDGSQTCRGTSSFAVIAGQVHNVNVVLSCANNASPVASLAQLTHPESKPAG